MKFLQIGLGSMGKRRIRCLKSLSQHDIVGFDTRVDRREEVESDYSIDVIDDINNVDFSAVDSIIVSTPPDRHNEYIEIAIQNKKPVFVEASACLDNLEELNRISKEENVTVVPSCTMLFHPAIKEIDQIIKSKKYGKVTNFVYHSGQYLPDWHPWENIKDYYVSKKETGGAKEIVAFELTWLASLFGLPLGIRYIKGRTMDMGVDIDDTYAVLMELNEGIGSFVIDVVARYANRSLVLNMEQAQVVWRWDNNVVRLYKADSQEWIDYGFVQSTSAEGYNKNISESMYVDELNSFVESINGGEPFINNLDKDIEILKLLERIDGDQ